MKSLLDFPQVVTKGQKSFNLTTEPEKIQQWKTIDRTRNRWINGIIPVVRSAFKDEQRRVKHAITSMLSPASTIASVEEEIRSTRDEWAVLLTNIFIPVGRALAANVINDLKKSTSPTEFKALSPDDLALVDPQILDYLENSSSLKVERITEATRRLLRSELRAGVEAGEGVQDIAKRIDTLYLEQIIPNRSKVIARTEVIQASNLGSISGAKATGIPGLKKVWLATRDSRTREAHALVDGETVPIDSSFDLSSGSRLMFPGDTSLGASAGDTIQCRCTQFYEGE